MLVEAMMFILNSLGFFMTKNEPRKTNFESILHKYVGCFKLIVFEFGTSCVIWMI